MVQQWSKFELNPRSKIQPPHFLPNTETIFPTLLTLPLHEDLSFQDVDFISSTLNHTYGNC